MQDKDYYRVFDLRMGILNITNNASTALFHRSIGGYHPAKLSVYQDLIENQLYHAGPNCRPVLNMLNAKYIIQPNNQGRRFGNGQPGHFGSRLVCAIGEICADSPGCHGRPDGSGYEGYGSAL